MPFEIIRNDITRMKVDAIVNTANPRPVIGRGTDSAIHAKAGPELLEARKKIGEIRPGHASATPAYGLSARYVLHTVSPVWQGGDHRETELLRQAYDAALHLAAELDCRSIAFPLMATGSYGFPKDKAMSVAIQSFTDFLLSSDMRIYLVVFGGKAFSLAGGLFADLKSYIDENYVAEQSAREYPDGIQNARRREIAALCGGTFSSAPAFLNTPTPQNADSSISEALANTEATFTETLQRLIERSGEKDSVIYGRVFMSRQLFHKIISDKAYQPRKSTAVLLAIALHLTVEETQDLLAKAGYTLSRSSKSDVAVEYFLRRGEYDILNIEAALLDANLPTLLHY